MVSGRQLMVVVMTFAQQHASASQMKNEPIYLDLIMKAPRLRRSLLAYGMLSIDKKSENFILLSP